MKITSAHVIALVALVASLGGGFALAHDGDTDKVHFCIANDRNGDVRAVSPGSPCAVGETAADVRTQNVAYQEATPGPQRFAATRRYRRVSRQLYVPADGQEYVLEAKLTVSKGGGTRAGKVTCALNSTDDTPADRVTTSVRPGESLGMAFENRGKTDGRPGQTAATYVACASRRSAFTIADVKVTATPVSTVSKGVPVA